MRFAKRMPMVTLSWNNMLRAPRILVGAISERKTGTACYTVMYISDDSLYIYMISMPMVRN